MFDTSYKHLIPMTSTVVCRNESVASCCQILEYICWFLDKCINKFLLIRILCIRHWHKKFKLPPRAQSLLSWFLKKNSTWLSIIILGNAILLICIKHSIIRLPDCEFQLYHSPQLHDPLELIITSLSFYCPFKSKW